MRQGCVLSPTLLCLYTKELIARVRRMNAGMRVREEKISMPLHADVVVMSEPADELQSILDMLEGMEEILGSVLTITRVR